MDGTEEAHNHNGHGEASTGNDLLSIDIHADNIVNSEENLADNKENALVTSFISDKDDSASAVKDAQKQKQREERLRQFKEQQEQEKQKKLQEFLDAQRRADEQRKKHEDEKKRKLEELRKKENERHLTVEERRQKLENEDRERKLAVLRKYAEKDAKLTELRSTRSPTQGAYAFGSRLTRSVTSSPVDSSRRVASQGMLLNDVAVDSSPVTPKAADRSKAASACNLSARGLPDNNKLVGEWSKPQSATSVRDVRNHAASASDSMPLTRRSPRAKGMSASTSLIVSAHGDEAASGSASIHAPHRRGRSIEPKNRSVTSSIDRLATPKSRGKSMDVLAASADGSHSTSERRTPERTLSAKHQKSAASPSSNLKSMPVTLKPLAKLTKPPHATAKISSAKGPVKAVHLNLTSKNDKPIVNGETTEDVASNSEAAGDGGKLTESGDVPASNDASQNAADVSASGQDGAIGKGDASSKTGGRDSSRTHSVKAPAPTAAADKAKAATAQDKDKDGGEAAAGKGQGQSSVEEEYKAKLAEKRRLAREKAEQEAAEAKRIAEEKKREEEERQKREEEEQQRREEEEMRQAEEARLAEDERLRLAQEAEEVRRKLDEEKKIVEQKAREDALRKAQEEKEKLDKEREERAQKEEQERQSRKKRLDNIMKRVKPEDSSGKADAVVPGNAAGPEQGVNGGSESQDGSKFKSPLLQQIMGNKSRGLQSTSPRSGSPQRAADGVSDGDIISHDHLSTSLVDDASPYASDESSVIQANPANNESTTDVHMAPSLLEFIADASDNNTNARPAASDVSTAGGDDSSLLSCIDSGSNVDQSESAQWKSSKPSSVDNVNGIHHSPSVNSHDSDADFKSSSDTDFKSPRDYEFEQLISVPEAGARNKQLEVASPIVAFEPND